MEKKQINSDKRLLWLDYSKGIGILLVLIAHGLAKTNWINIYAYSFHLPLFFIIGGMTIKEQKMLNESYLSMLKRNAKAIIVPYYFYGAFVVLVELTKNMLQGDAGIENTTDILFRYVTLRGLKADWFLPCLFFSKVIFISLYRILKKEKKVCVMCLIIAIVVMLLPMRPMIFRPVLCAGIGAFFTSVGYVVREIHKKINWKLTAGVLAIWIVFSTINGKVSLLIYNFGENIILYLINGILGTIMLIGLTKLIENKEIKIKGLQWLGINSMVIMVVHMEIMALLNSIMPKIPVISDNVFVLKSSIIIVTLILSIMVTPVIDKVYKKIFVKQ